MCCETVGEAIVNINKMNLLERFHSPQPLPWDLPERNRSMQIVHSMADVLFRYGGLTLGIFYQEPLKI
jgi:hypothetical protein